MIGLKNKSEEESMLFHWSSWKKELPNYSEIAEKSALRRFSEKGEIISIYKGYYLILSDQYALKGMLPPLFFLIHLWNF
jgi:hypothetical protein